MNIVNTTIAGAVVIETKPFQDHRGAFSRLFCERELSQVIGPQGIVQINHSRTTTRGAVRGLHFQHAPHAEMKLVRCLKGRVWDVVVDLRANSETFLKWHAEELSPENGRMLVIPQGCAHGFQVLETESELLYLHTAFYEPGAEGAVRHDDPRLAIIWPLPVTDLSERDKNHALLSTEFAGLHV
ncbi:dTDP-4-dehydrorhamnose 3,5-epimerase [Pseudomonas costantinii]|uniref:dTDP-4-dehydrorhamnose 3,5-epimerase n=1 Tax=Pseudomonas costantinii TaxID=168469 RepID=A0A1S2V481_9PSED|nr:dTDP-4-dehydrorhamnose 3,5-epimerase [Pseudomonas costantinii]OIN53511.1 dTDP-4-dehydrorhamnose 3,5-epimerase [Pseudomonas costantinii]SEE36218.1 dTDP-4-dehydrorhamnose 3,5-epimerase [Pseudomonas costantinii]